MTLMHFDLEDGLPAISFSLNTEECERFVEFMAKCQAIKESPQRKPLTEDEIVKMDEWLFDQSFWLVLMLVRAVEAAHGIKGEA